MAKKKFSVSHLKALAKKGKGGLAKWAKKQLGGKTKTTSTHTRSSPRKSNITMAKRTTKRRAPRRSGGGGSVIENLAGGAGYGVVESSIPTVARMNPLLRVAVAGYAATKMSGPVKAVGKAILSVEGYKIGKSINVSGLLGSQGVSGAAPSVQVV